MRHPFATELTRTIRSSLTRFLAIMGIVGLGVGFYAGLNMTGQDMRQAADAYYDGTQLYDLRVLSTLGLTDEQLGTIEELESVEQVMGGYAADVMAALHGERYAMRIMSCDMDAARAASVDKTGALVTSTDDGYLNRIVLAQGDWPSSPDECLLSADRVMGKPIEVGDSVEVLYGTSSLDDVLVYRSFTVSGLVHSSFFPSSVTLGYTNLGSGTIKQFLYVSPQAFSSELPYTEVFVTVKGAQALENGSEAYQTCVDEAAQDIEGLGLGPLRLAQVKAEAEEKLADAQSEYDDGRAEADRELGDAQAQLDDALSQLKDAEAAIVNGQAELDDGIAELASARAKAKRELAAGRRELEANEKKLDEAEEQLGMTQADIDAARNQLDEADAAWQEQRTQLVAARNDLVTVEAALDALADLAQIEDPTEEQRAEARAKVSAAMSAAQDLFDTGLVDPMSEEVRARIEELAGDIIDQLEGIDFSGDPAEVFEQLRALVPAIRDQLVAAIDDTLRQLDEGMAQGDAAIAEARAQLNQAQDARTTIDAGRAQLAQGWKTFHEQEAQANRQLASAQRTLDDAAAQLADARQQLADGKADYSEGLKTYNDSRAEVESRLADAASQLAAARGDINALEEPSIYVLDRSMNAGVSAYFDDSKRIDSIGSVFPFVFFLVAALVSLTTMTRMVEDERIDIGTHRALGFSIPRITAKYVAYAGIAGLVGSIIGIAALSQILPWVVQVAYAIIYTVPMHRFPLPIDLGISTLSTLLGLGVTFLAIFGAAAATLKEVPASLMLPRAPKAGKRILLEHIAPIWRRLSFSWKVTCRNLFRYKQRLAMTIVGVAGCTALLLTGFGLHDSIWDIIAYQHEGEHPISHHNISVGMEDGATAQDMDAVKELLARVGGADSFARYDLENMQASSDASDGMHALQVNVVTDCVSFADMVEMRERKSGSPISFGPSSVVITEKIAGRLGVEAGGRIRLYDLDEIGNATGEGYELTITGVTENYVYHYLYVGEEAWEEATGKPCAIDTMSARIRPDEETRLAVADALAKDGEVANVSFSTETIEAYRKSLQSVNMVVIVLVVAAAALAYIVLYNLINIQLIERSREIASLKVLGFNQREVAGYLFRETIVLVVLGALVGLALGTVMEAFVVTTAEVDAVMFGRDIHLPSYLYAFGLTLVFSLLVMACVSPKLRRIDMVESLKSVD